MKKCMLRWIIVLTVALPCFLISASARTTIASGTCTPLGWAVYSDGELVIHGSGKMPDFNETYAPWIQYRSYITNLTVKSGVTGIGYSAFAGCSKLVTAVIAGSVTDIGGMAFGGCTKLTSVNIPASVKSIGAAAFTNCPELTSINIPASVTNIGGSAFARCYALSAIHVDPANPAFCSVDDVLFTKDMTRLIHYPANNERVNYSVPDGVVAIDWGSFMESDFLSSVTIPDTVIDMGGPTFYGCDNLTSVSIGNGLLSIPEQAFYGCSSLTSVNIGASVATISDEAFRDCTSLASINIPDSTTKIGASAFRGCANLVSATIGDSVAEIGGQAFLGCTSLSSIAIPGNATNIGSEVFYGCVNLVSATIRDGVTNIGTRMFSGCTNLSSVTIGNSVVTIGQEAFSDCVSLTNISIPNSVSEIKSHAFHRCTGLTKVEFFGVAPDCANDYVFKGCDNLTIYYHEDTDGWPTTGTWQSCKIVMIPRPRTITDTGRSISLGDQIYINQYVTVSDFDGIDVAAKGGLLIWNSPVAEEDALYGTADTTQKGLIAYEGEYTQRTLGISAKNYADELYLRVYIEVADGAFVYGPLTEYSVQHYCEHKINTEGYTADLKKTCAALLHYGAMAQRYFNYNTNDLANANILEVYPAPAWMTED